MPVLVVRSSRSFGFLVLDSLGCQSNVVGMLAPVLFVICHCIWLMIKIVPLILWNGCNVVFKIEMNFSIFWV